MAKSILYSDKTKNCFFFNFYKNVQGILLKDTLTGA